MAALKALPDWDRFAHWAKQPARLLLLALTLVLLTSVLVPIGASGSPATNASATTANQTKNSPDNERDEDLKLYDKAIDRISKGERYYSFIVAEHRLAHYPLRPGYTVRLPTLAYLDAWLGAQGQLVAAVLLLVAIMTTWWQRLAQEPGGLAKRSIAAALLLLGTSLGLSRGFFVLHELWAGMLRVASLAIAAAALAIREFALPFVLLMGAMAFWRGDRNEGAGWTSLAIVFLVLFCLHTRIIDAQTLLTDAASPGWLTFRGLSGWLSNVVLSSNLRFMPHWLAGPAVILAMFGWSGWRCPAGSFGTLLFAGYATIFMIAGHDYNFYWGFMIAPALLMGLAFAPGAAKSLWKSAEFTKPRSR
jgi:hypothetical protein